MSDIDELYVLARRVLLDALDGLGTHRGAIVLVGAQGVYLRTGEADIAVAPYTTDADLAVDPATLDKVPPLEDALRRAGFVPRASDSVGVWIAERPTADHGLQRVAVDLLVPAAVSPGTGRRAAKLDGHDARVARIVRGLDGAVVDADVLSLAALDPTDGRSFDVRVAGPAALLIAKAYKIADRVGTNRLNDKDALDVFRLLRATETAELARRFAILFADSRSRETTIAGCALLEEQFAERTSVGVAMAVRSTEALMDRDEVIGSIAALMAELRVAIAR